MQLESNQLFLFELIASISYAVLFIFPIAVFPTSFSKTVHAFHLPSEHKIITYSEYSEYVWISASIPPLIAISLSTVSYWWNVFFIILTTFVIFLVIHPQSFAFGTDAIPGDFETIPTWSVYMAIYAPIGSALLLHLYKLFLQT